jgi:hypothetical protein
MLRLSDDSINRWLKRGFLIGIHRGVYRIAAVPPSYHQVVWAACSRTRAAASHRCAMKLWDLDGYRGRIVEVTRVGPNHRYPKGIIVHTTDQLPEPDLQTIGPLRVTSPTRTLIDLGAVLPPARVEEALESALRQGLTTIEQLRDRLEALGGPGRRGSGVLRRLIDTRQRGQKPTGSTFEVRMVRLLAQKGLPIPVRQFEIFDDRTFVARPDLCYPELKIAIEAQSVEWHLLRRDAWLRDMDRLNRLQALGWIVIQVSWNDLANGGDAIIAHLRTVLQQRTSSLCS